MRFTLTILERKHAFREADEATRMNRLIHAVFVFSILTSTPAVADSTSGALAAVQGWMDTVHWNDVDGIGADFSKPP